jgi:hypothetical protein
MSGPFARERQVPSLNDSKATLRAILKPLMDSRPPTPTRRTEVFISAASADLKGTRTVVKQAVDTIGCHGVYQEEFPPDYRTVDEMLRSHITNCEAVIHIAGVCYGSEPRGRPPDKARRSYTQMEYDIAQELGRPLYVFVCAEAYPYDVHSPEPDDMAALQQAHREACLGRLEIREKAALTHVPRASWKTNG